MNLRSPAKTPQQLRAEVHARGVHFAGGHACEVGWTRTRSVLYAAAEQGSAAHGNFLPASYRRILARPGWARRLEKAYTAAANLPRANDRRRNELECAASSDALLMNVFCYPGVLRRPAVCAMLGVEAGLVPEFGVRAALPMLGDEVDRTEFDMQLGSLSVEAKLTEGGFGTAARERLLRYRAVEQNFDLDALPRTGRGFAGYQLIRGLLAASQRDATYLVLLDARRPDLEELCLRVLVAGRTAEVRSRLRLRTWQELAAGLPQTLQRFLAERFGIEPR